MEYTEVKFKINPTEPFSEIISCELAEIGFESFEENEEGITAFIPSVSFGKDKIDDICVQYAESCELSYECKAIAEENWNKVWEESYHPILIDDFCFVYAPFHEPNPQAEYNILIEPKMSFGTAHHATTANMISFLKTEHLENKTVLDMGSGTGVLAILAALRGATKVDAIDIDEWAYENAKENIERNHQEAKVHAELGEASLLQGRTYDVVIANINRNILLNDMPVYAQCLPPKGVLLLSGFYESDIPVIRQKAEALGFSYNTHREKDSWVAIRFTKIN